VVKSFWVSSSGCFVWLCIECFIFEKFGASKLISNTEVCEVKPNLCLFQFLLFSLPCFLKWTLGKLVLCVSVETATMHKTQLIVYATLASLGLFLNLMQSYLSRRSQFVSLGGSRSNLLLHINCGAPQSSALDSLLFWYMVLTLLQILSLPFLHLWTVGYDLLKSWYFA